MISILQMFMEGIFQAPGSLQVVGTEPDTAVLRTACRWQRARWAGFEGGRGDYPGSSLDLTGGQPLGQLLLV